MAKRLWRGYEYILWSEIALTIALKIVEVIILPY